MSKLTKKKFIEIMNETPDIWRSRRMRVVAYFPVALGVGVSVQGSADHYCEPREIFDDFGKYTHLEVYTGDHPYLEGFLSAYIADETVAARVPIDDIVEALNCYSEHMAKYGVYHG